MSRSGNTWLHRSLDRLEMALELASDEAVGWRSLGSLFLIGGLLALAGIPVSVPRDAHPSEVMAIGITAVIVGIAMWRWAGALPVRLISPALAFGTLLIMLVVLASGQPNGRYALFYVWVALEAYYFLSPRVAALHMASVAVTYGVALVVLDGGFDQLALVLGTVVTTGWLTGALRARINRLSAQAKTDPLTGVANRRGFDEHIERGLLDGRQRGERVSVVLVDLDRFKLVNDRYGHAQGDAVLRRFADLCTKVMAFSPARLGGDEFAVLVPGRDVAATADLARRLAERIRADAELARMSVTISAGVASFPAHGDSPRALMQAADAALYHAKRRGRDHVVGYGPRTEHAPSRNLDTDAHTQNSLDAAILLSETLDLRDTSTSAHSQTVARYAQAIAVELGLAADQCERIHLAGVVHDLGKIGITDQILLKPGPLSDAEWEMMRRHPEIGARILQSAGLGDLAAWVIAHHERPDGNGYPFGTKGDEIPLEARILAVADAFEAMTTDRPYRRGMSRRDATDELLRHRDKQFDGAVIDALLRGLGPDTEARDASAEPSVRRITPVVVDGA